MAKDQHEYPLIELPEAMRTALAKVTCYCGFVVTARSGARAIRYVTEHQAHARCGGSSGSAD